MARETITVTLPSTPKFIPPLTEGDREYAGHGPRVNLHTRLEVRNSNELWARVWMRARETKRDWTTAEGTAEYLVYRDREISRIYRILSDPVSFDSYEDTDHEDDVLVQSDAELVKEYVVTGDTKGSEAGLRTGVTVHFNPVTLDVERVTPPEGVETIRVGPLPKFVPQHVNGDREFAGHGPRVEVSARIYVRNTYELWTTIWMRARETQSDWTEATGSTNYLLYRHDRPIQAIVSDTYSAHTYVDTDHADDEFALGPNDLVERFVCTGDTGGSEAGTRTGVTVHFNPIDITPQSRR